jgi:hypothetical protein
MRNKFIIYSYHWGNVGFVCDKQHDQLTVKFVINDAKRFDSFAEAHDFVWGTGIGQNYHVLEVIF